MSTIKIIFCSSEDSQHDSELECYMNQNKEIYINIESPNNQFNFICLNKEAAIKFSKVLRTEISKISDNG